MTEEDLLDILEDHLVPRPPPRLGVAVSGGSDSVALLCLLARLCARLDVVPLAITIDHGLRKGAAAEVRSVTDLCARLGVEHHVEYWKGWDGHGNLQAAARGARYELIADWAMGNDIGTVALAHTANDQAETLLMRLARGAGVDGLSAMAPRRMQSGVTWLRPLLGVGRRDLRAYLQGQGIGWMDDPSNEDRTFERVRMRDALALLEPLGLTIQSLSQVAQNMRKAREALDWQTFLAARDTATVRLGTIQLDMRQVRILPEEIARRLVVRAVMWVSSSVYAPRRASVDVALAAIRSGGAATLDGVQIQRSGDRMWVFREYAAVDGLTCDVGDLWDARWTIEGPEDDPDFQVRAMGPDGLKQVEDWRDLGLPRAALLSMPAVWHGAEMIAAPVFGTDEDWFAEIEDGADTFFAALLSH